MVASRLADLGWLWMPAALILLAFATQHYALGSEQIDVDEATFMVVAQSVLRNGLPYIEALDNKPPLFFLILAGGMAAMGETVEAVRLFGDAAIAATAVILFVLCKRYVSQALAFALAAAFVVSHAGHLGESTNSEIIANLFVATSLLVLASLPNSNRASYAAGVMIGCAVLVRTNLVYLALGVTLLHLFAIYRPAAIGLRRWSVIALSFGGLTPLLAVVGLFALHGQLPLLWVAAVELPLEYARSRTGTVGLVWIPLGFLRLVPGVSSVIVLLLILGLGSVMSLLRQDAPKTFLRDRVIFATFLVSICLSIAMTGSFYNHYMLQTFPPVLGLGAVSLALAGKKLTNWVLTGTTAIVALGTVWFGVQGALLVSRQIAGEVDHPIADAAAAIEAYSGSDDSVWALGNQLILFFLDRDPMLPIGAFPANLRREAMYAPLVRAGLMPADPMHAIFEQRPRYVVLSQFEPPSGLAAEDQTAFSEEYEQWWAQEGVVVARRINTAQ
ncbi:ArnT family glycosyltransferase [Devosia sp.]|uniref:ArnT family glycosyltransferase n=1 Tax=Devosia sp. TaxID=1871048 RepID=UPI003A95970A